MLGLSGLEIGFFALTAGGIAVGAIALFKGREFNPGLAVFLASIMIPVVGPVIALGYGASLLFRSWRSRARA
jgi:ABC-type spermidine/putrescine transport system permease subunit II